MYILCSLLNQSILHVHIAGIAGGSGSGKTTLARAIYDSIGGDNISYISHDSYYKDLSHLSSEERGKQNFDHPDSLVSKNRCQIILTPLYYYSFSFMQDTDLLVQHIALLKNGQSIEVPIYDFKTHSRLPTTESIAARPVILVEGILIFSDADLYSTIDIRIFVDTDDDIRYALLWIVSTILYDIYHIVH